MCNFPFFEPLEAEFEKVDFTKDVALAMLYHIILKIRKKFSTAIYARLEHGMIRLEPRQFFMSNFRGSFFNFDFFQWILDVPRV